MIAAEWLFEQLCSEKLSWNKDSNGKLFFDNITSDILQQAKEMEKQRMIAFAKYCLNNAKYLNFEKALFNVEEYYQIFKSE